MTKLIVSEFVSLNGIMEAPGGEKTHPHTGWTFEAIYGEDHYDYKLEELEEAGSALLGRKTYEGFAAASPEREGPFAEKINAMPKYVGGVTTLMTQAKEAAGEKNVLVRGARTGSSQSPAASSTRTSSMSFPVLFGRGRRLFEALAAEQIELERSRILEGENAVTTCATGSGDEFSGVDMS